ncbi:MAG: FtsX-like permease family protein [Anaerolineae bacterium]
MLLVKGLVRKVYRDLTKRRVRSLLTLLGIVVGVAGMVAIVSTAKEMVRAQERTYNESSLADVTIWVWNAPIGLTRVLRNVPNIEGAELRLTTYSKWLVGQDWQDIYFVGISDFGKVHINRIELVEGHLPGPDEVLLDISVKEVTDVAIGQRITYRAGAAGRPRELTVAGFSRSPNFLSTALTNIAVAYTPASQVRKMLDMDGYNQLLLRMADFNQRDETIEEVVRLLDKRRIRHGQPRVRDPAHYPGKRELDALFALLFLFSMLGLGISAFLVANTLAAIVAEQVSEIGVMKAVGGTRAQILQVYLITSFIYGLAGTLLGIAAGAIGGWRLLAFLGQLGNIQVTFRLAPEGVLLGSVVGLGVTILAGLPPALRGTAIPVKEALDSYGITSTYGQGRLDRLLQGIKGFPPLMAMSLRNLARRKTRNLVTMLVIALATAAFLAAQSTSTSVNGAIDEVFSIYNADAWIWFEEPVGTNFADMIRLLPEVDRVEPWNLVDTWVKYGQTRLWGLPADTELYRAVLKAGRWYRPGEHHAVVVSADLAAERDIRVGDVIRVEVGEESRSFEVVGLAIDNSVFLGSATTGKVFAPLEVINRMLKRYQQATFFALRLDSSDPRHVEQVLAELERKFRRLRPVTQPAYRELDTALEQSKILSLALAGMVILVAIVGGLGMVNTLALNVLERRREIGVMRAIGATDINLIQAFLTEGLSLGLLGWTIGVVGGYIFGKVFVAQMERVLFRINYIFPPVLLVVGLAFALLLAAVASLGPALGAAHTPAGEALRYE